MGWRSLLRDDPLPWLLERRDPAVRAMALRSLLDRSSRDPELREAQQRAMSVPPISTIIGRQRTDGGWPGPTLHGPKYESTHWANLLLVEYGVDPADPRIRRAARHVLDQLGSPETGGMDWVFGRDHGVSCFVGNAVRYIALGRTRILVRPGARFAVLALTDAPSVSWLFHGARGQSPHGTLRFRAPKRGGVYRLYVTTGGHSAKALVVVG